MFERIFGKRPTNKEIVLEKAKYNLWQDVWVMNNNRPVKVRIVSVKVEGRYSQFTHKCTASSSYKVTESDYYSEYHGVDIDESRLYETKQELLNTLK
tara:strand:+ start:3427 stop:3717 length:291 start_codon:yes stop_codon:yes gene_type:complete